MQHFGILERSLLHGWPKVRVEACVSCGVRYLVYIAEFEPRNGWCQGVLQGVTELAPSNYAFKRTAGTGHDVS